jgi:hypothetical protein
MELAVTAMKMELPASDLDFTVNQATINQFQVH